jgi:hypothetical protein
VRCHRAATHSQWQRKRDAEFREPTSIFYGKSFIHVSLLNPSISNISSLDARISSRRNQQPCPTPYSTNHIPCTDLFPFCRELERGPRKQPRTCTPCRLFRSSLFAVSTYVQGNGTCRLLVQEASRPTEMHTCVAFGLSHGHLLMFPHEGLCAWLWRCIRQQSGLLQGRGIRGTILKVTERRVF